MSDTLKTNMPEELREVAQGKPELTIKTLGELLEAAKDKPELLERAHQKVWRVISSPITINVGGKNPEILYPEVLSELKGTRMQRLFHDQPFQRKRYPIFSSDLFGIDPELAISAEFFRESNPLAIRGQKFLEIISSTGCGKTTWREIIANGMRKEEFFFLKDCPYREHPLHAIPIEERGKFFARLPRFRGELCRQCEQYMQKELHGKWEDFPVDKEFYRQSAGIGMSQQEAPLPRPGDCGEIPNAWYNMFKHANGGVLFINLSIQPAELRSMLALYVTDGVLKAEDQTDWWPDFAVVNISNQKLLDVEPSNPLLKDRIVTVMFRMTTDPEVELLIHQKDERINDKPSFHFVPWVKKAFYHTVAASRLQQKHQQQQAKLTLLGSEEALKYYSGSATLTSSDKGSLVTHSYRELRTKRPDDGSSGITVRDAAELEAAAGQFNTCVGITHLTDALKEARIHQTYQGEAAQRIEEWLGSGQGSPQPSLMEKLYQKWLVTDLVRGWSGIKTFEEKRLEFFKKYLNHAGAFVTGGKPKEKEIDEHGKEKEVETEIDAKFLEKIEERAGIRYDSERTDFRNGVNSFYGKSSYDPDDYPPLGEAITAAIVDEYRYDIRLAITGEKPNDPKKVYDPQKAKKHLEETGRELLSKLGYKECCWLTVLSYAPRMFKNV